MFDLALLAPERLRPLRADEYMRLAETGAFDDERVELLAGVLVAMSPQGADHLRVTGLLHRLLIKALDDRWFVASNATLRLADDSVPEPDVWVAPARARTLGRAALVVEVSRTSLTMDRDIKRHLYAAAKVPEYWLVDLRHRRVEVRTRPAGQDYRDVRIVGRDGILRPRAMPALSLAVADFLPARPFPEPPRRARRTRIVGRR